MCTRPINTPSSWVVKAGETFYCCPSFWRVLLSPCLTRRPAKRPYAQIAACCCCCCCPLELRTVAMLGRPNAVVTHFVPKSPPRTGRPAGRSAADRPVPCALLMSYRLCRLASEIDQMIEYDGTTPWTRPNERTNERRQHKPGRAVSRAGNGKETDTRRR